MPLPTTPITWTTGQVVTAAQLNGNIRDDINYLDAKSVNQLVNGGLEWWQRGTGAFTAQSAYSADRWQNGLAGTDTLSISKNTANVDAGSNACAACTFTLGTGAGATFLGQFLRTSDGHQVGGRTFSVSARVSTTTANAVRIAILSDGTGGTTVYSAFHTGTGTYQTLTVTYTAPANATYVAVGLYFAVSCTAYLDSVMLTLGGVAVDYVPLTPADDLARCLRYYQRWAPGSANAAIASGQAFSTTQAVFALPLQARLGGSPTLTLSAQADWGVSNAGFAITANTTLSIRSGSANGQSIDLIVNPASAAVLVAGNATMLCAISAANSWLALEWNP